MDQISLTSFLWNEEIVANIFGVDTARFGVATPALCVMTILPSGTSRTKLVIRWIIYPSALGTDDDNENGTKEFATAFDLLVVAQHPNGMVDRSFFLTPLQ